MMKLLVYFWQKNDLSSKWHFQPYPSALEGLLQLSKIMRTINIEVDLLNRIFSYFHETILTFHFSIFDPVF
jgi:hypothetical protein